jgi:hypothetical protein
MTKMTTAPTSEIVIYQTEDGLTKLDVMLKEETTWLNLNQITSLFERDKSVISKHIRNVYKEGELKDEATVAKFATVQREGGRTVEREIEFYNLDVIISVGYRIKSLRGTQFRIWATQVLKDHLVKGYTINEKRLKEQNERLRELQQTIDLLGRVLEERQLEGQEADGLLRVVADYSLALRLLDDYDYSRLAMGDTTGKPDLSSPTKWHATRLTDLQQLLMLPVALSLAARKTTLSKARLARSIRPLTERRYIRA